MLVPSFANLHLYPSIHAGEKMERKKSIKGILVTLMKQVMRGYNIVTDGWAGGYYPYHSRRPPPKKKTNTGISYAFHLCVTDQQSDGRTQSFRAASPRRKMNKAK